MIEALDLSQARWDLLKNRQPIRPAARWDAAKRDRLTFDILRSILSANQEIALDQQQLVAVSRSLANNDPTMAKFLASIWKNVFGPDGIKLQSKVPLQRGPKLNSVANTIIEGAWADWSKKENCSLDRRLSWIQMQRVVSRTVAVDGECFIRKAKTARNPFGFSLQIISSDQVDRAFGQTIPLQLPNGNRIFMGIEIDQDLAVVAYHIFDRHPSEIGSGPRQRIRVPAEEILHIFLPIRDNQLRGIPWASASMIMMNQLKGYREAETIAARVAACQMGFITKDLDPNAEGDPNPDDAVNNGGSEMALEAGSFKFLLPGEKIEQFKPEHPTTAFESFTKGANLAIAAGLDQSYMTLTGDVGAANYSSARVGLLDERDTYEGLQGFFVEEFCQPVYSEWLKMSFLTYLRSLPGADYRVYDKAEWHPRSFPWVDPLKDTQASILQMSSGLTTLHRELAARGYDYDETIAELRSEKKDRDELGLKVDTKGVVDAGAQPEVQPATTPNTNPNGKLLTDLVMLVDR